MNNKLTQQTFERLPLVIEGESKQVRYMGEGEVAIQLKPTIYSYTHNRTGVVTGTDTLRLQAIQAFKPILEQAGVTHTYKDLVGSFIISQLVLQPVTTDNPHPFRPHDLTERAIALLPVAPPIEVVVKQRHTGTPKHRYYRFDQYSVRASHPSYPNTPFTIDEAYPEPVVRFDWRNPMIDHTGNRLADEVLGEQMADWFINVDQASKTAQRAFDALQHFLNSKGLELWDICFFISEDGKKLFGEVSPDCMRIRAKDGTSLDKDIWRAGGSSSDVLNKWQTLINLIKEDRNELTRI